MPARAKRRKALAAEAGERRCLASGETLPQAKLIRFVVGPDGVVVADLSRELPGRGFWVRADRQALELAVQKKLLAGAASKALGGKVKVPGDLAATVGQQLRRRALAWLGLAKRAGLARTGFEKVSAWLQKSGGSAGPKILLTASDASPKGRQKLGRLTAECVAVDDFSGLELSLAMGLENVVHAALADGPLARRFLAEIERLRGFYAAPDKKGLDESRDDESHAAEQLVE